MSTPREVKKQEGVGGVAPERPKEALPPGVILKSDKFIVVDKMPNALTVEQRASLPVLTYMLAKDEEQRWQMFYVGQGGATVGGTEGKAAGAAKAAADLDFLRLDPGGPQTDLEPGKVYLKNNGGVLSYRMKTVGDTVVTGVEPFKLDANGAPENFSQWINKNNNGKRVLAITAEANHTAGAYAKKIFTLETTAFEALIKTLPPDSEGIDPGKEKEINDFIRKKKQNDDILKAMNEFFQSEDTLRRDTASYIAAADAPGQKLSWESEFYLQPYRELTTPLFPTFEQFEKETQGKSVEEKIAYFRDTVISVMGSADFSRQMDHFADTARRQTAALNWFAEHPIMKENAEHPDKHYLSQATQRITRYGMALGAVVAAIKSAYPSAQEMKSANKTPEYEKTPPGIAEVLGNQQKAMLDQAVAINKTIPTPRKLRAMKGVYLFSNVLRFLSTRKNSDTLKNPTAAVFNEVVAKHFQKMSFQLKKIYEEKGMQPPAAAVKILAEFKIMLTEAEKSASDPARARAAYQALVMRMYLDAYLEDCASKERYQRADKTPCLQCMEQFVRAIERDLIKEKGQKGLLVGDLQEYRELKKHPEASIFGAVKRSKDPLVSEVIAGHLKGRVDERVTQVKNKVDKLDRRGEEWRADLRALQGKAEEAQKNVEAKQRNLEAKKEELNKVITAKAGGNGLLRRLWVRNDPEVRAARVAGVKLAKEDLNRAKKEAGDAQKVLGQRRQRYDEFSARSSQKSAIMDRHTRALKKDVERVLERIGVSPSTPDHHSRLWAKPESAPLPAQRSKILNSPALSIAQSASSNPSQDEAPKVAPLLMSKRPK